MGFIFPIGFENCEEINMISTVGMTVTTQNQLDCRLEGSVLGRRCHGIDIV